MASNQSIILILRAENDDLKRKLTDSEKHAKKTTKGMQSGFNKLNFRNFLYGSFGIYAVQRAFKMTMKPAIEFESQLAKDSTILDKSKMKMSNFFVLFHVNNQCTILFCRVNLHHEKVHHK